jgi:CRISPR-associated protein Csx3
MASTFLVEVDSSGSGEEVLLHVRFGTAAENDQIVRDAEAAMQTLNLKGGSLVKFNGRASLPVAMVLCHAVAHMFGAVAVFDPKLGKYVVCVSHDPKRPIGALLD